jgi:hypothetical protein
MKRIAQDCGFYRTGNLVFYTGDRVRRTKEKWALLNDMDEIAPCPQFWGDQTVI